MKILHLSDIHLTEYGREIWGVNTLKNFQCAIEKIKTLKDIDAIIISGDLSDNGCLWSYEFIDRTFAALGIPTYCCLGNHDSLTVIPKEYSPSFCKFIPSKIINAWNFVFINSVIPDEEEPTKNKARGEIKDKDMLHIENELQKGLPTCIVLHHPPLEPGGWLNRKLLENRNEFHNLLNKYKNVKLVLFGHIHCFLQTEINKIKYSSAPSIGFGFDKDLPKFQIAENTEGFNIITIEEGIINIQTILLYAENDGDRIKNYNNTKHM